MRFLILALISWLLIATPAEAKIKNFGLESFGGDQYDAGFAEVNKKVEDWIKQAKAVAVTTGKAWQEEVSKIVNQELSKGVTAYVSPDGLVRATDGHHKMAAASKLVTEHGVPQDSIRVGVDVLKDFSEKKPSDADWLEYVKWREKHDPAYFDKAERAAAKGPKDLVKLYRGLPNSLRELRDSPMRSAMGGFFDALTVRGNYFEPAAQFKLGEEFKALGLQVKAGEEYSDATQDKILSMMFKDRESSGKLQKAMLDLARPEKREEVSRQLKLATAVLGSKTVPVGPYAPHPAIGEADGEGGVVTGRMGSGKSKTCGLRYADLAHDVKSLPERIKIPSNEGLMGQLLSDAEKRSMSELKLDELKGIVKKLAEGGEISGQEQKLLKTTRKSGLVLRSAVKLMGTEDTKDAVKPYRRFVRELGELYDYLEDWDFKGKMPKDMKKAAGELHHLIKEGFEPEKLVGRTQADFLNKQKEVLGWVRDTLAKDKDGTLTIGEYHELRRNVRDYRVMFELLSDRYPGYDSVATAKYMRELDSAMGKVKDGLGIPPDAHKAKNFLDLPSKIDPDSRAKIDEFMRSMAGYTAGGAGELP
jgi:hypothetical protein